MDVAVLDPYTLLQQPHLGTDVVRHILECRNPRGCRTRSNINV